MLYTGKGDGGTTKFFDTKSGERVSKSSLISETLGSLDELNSFIGLCKAKGREEDSAVLDSTIFGVLHQIQENLFIVQAEVAGAEKQIIAEKIKRLEELTDSVEREIPEIKHFSIVGGTELSALLDVARTFARRTERAALRMIEAKDRELGEYTRKYLNRLSSILFALARLVNYRSGVREENPSYK